MLGILALVVNNFEVLTGGSTLTVWLLLGSVPVVFALGWRVGQARSATSVAAVEVPSLDLA